MCTVNHPKAQWLKRTHIYSFSFGSGTQEWCGWAFGLQFPNELQSSSSLSCGRQTLSVLPTRAQHRAASSEGRCSSLGEQFNTQCTGWSQSAHSPPEKWLPVTSATSESGRPDFVGVAHGCEQWRLLTQDWSWLSNTHCKGLFFCPSGLSQKCTAQVTLREYFLKLQNHLSFFQNQGAGQTCNSSSFKNNREEEWKAYTIEEAPLESTPRETQPLPTLSGGKWTTQQVSRCSDLMLSFQNALINKRVHRLTVFHKN